MRKRIYSYFFQYSSKFFTAGAMLSITMDMKNKSSRKILKQMRESIQLGDKYQSILTSDHFRVSSIYRINTGRLC